MALGCRLGERERLNRRSDGRWEMIVIWLELEGRGEMIAVWLELEERGKGVE